MPIVRRAFDSGIPPRMRRAPDGLHLSTNKRTDMPEPIVPAQEPVRRRADGRVMIKPFDPHDGGPGCWLDGDGFCVVHQTSNWAECANAKMNGYKRVNSRDEAFKVFLHREAK
jgi:hypothetical protein